jgi:hypothetical protein
LFNEHVELSKVQRELISRGAALCFGLVLCYGSYKCFLWTYRLLNDPVLEEMRSSPSQRKPAPITGPVVLGSLLGLGGLAVVGFAVLPTRVLYSINPMYNQSEPEDLMSRY